MKAAILALAIALTGCASSHQTQHGRQGNCHKPECVR